MRAYNGLKRNTGWYSGNRYTRKLLHKMCRRHAKQAIDKELAVELESITSKEDSLPDNDEHDKDH